MLVNHCLGVQGRIEPPPYGLREKIMSKLNRNKSTKNRFPLCTITPPNLLLFLLLVVLGNLSPV